MKFGEADCGPSWEGQCGSWVGQSTNGQSGQRQRLYHVYCTGPGVQLQHGAAAGPGGGLQEPGQPHQQAGQAGRHEVLQSAGALCLLSLH